jgi:hypothetical protein
MNRITTFRLACGTLLFLGAIALGSASHLPAMAAEGYQRFVEPMMAATCSSANACLQETNTKTGPGVKGVSSAGNGSVGQTKFASTSVSNGKAGVFGQDISASGSFDSGVLGSSTNGIGVQGTSTNGYGVMALSKNQTAFFAENSGFADGIQAIALGNDGTNSSTQNPSLTTHAGRSGVWGHDDSTDGGQANVGVAGSSTNGTGVSASSSNWVGLNVIGGTSNGNDAPAISVVRGPSGAQLLLGCSDPNDNPCTLLSASRVVDLNLNGDLILKGLLYTGVGGACHSGCAVGKNGASHRILSYAPAQTVPSIDDFGEAQLVNGHAQVRLSADFANIVDQRANYLVFITPEGDNRGLYVTQKTRDGFVVKESQGGKSTIAFSYRIVAKPFGIDKPRLPMQSIGRAR